ncbi:response regulator [candidate division KSB1 bacterium]|nr:response regulator [candidate division KSB1 bacterium]
MKGQTVLIVDDEKNIRLTISQALESLELDIETAVNGEEALEKIKQKEFKLILLDLKMPGMNGIEVLRQIGQIQPQIRVIIITAHGTIENAVETMKLGAIDFIQKPFAPKEIRALVLKVMDREKIEAQKATNYESLFELAKRTITERNFDAALEHVKKSIALDSSRPEAFNLLGCIYEIRGNRTEAQKNYRVALSLDPSYEAAQKNLSRSVRMGHEGDIFLGSISHERTNED